MGTTPSMAAQPGISQTRTTSQVSVSPAQQPTYLPRSAYHLPNNLCTFPGQWITCPTTSSFPGHWITCQTILVPSMVRILFWPTTMVVPFEVSCIMYAWPPSKVSILFMSSFWYLPKSQVKVLSTDKKKLLVQYQVSIILSAFKHLFLPV